MSAVPSTVCPSRNDDTTETTPTRRAIDNVSVLKSSRARPNKNQHGWGNLPDHLLHKILSFVLDDVALEPTLMVQPPAVPFVLALMRRNLLTSMRAVSSGWCKDIDSHPFWAELVATFRPDLAGLPGGTVRFSAVHANTKDVCLPCIMTPPHQPLRAVSPRLGTVKLGRVPVCRMHFPTVCSHCLRVDIATNRPGLWFRRPVVGDVDEFGQPRCYDGWLCLHCREAAFMSALRRDLLACSRGGSLRGLNNRWNNTVAFKEHVYFGVGRSDMMARQAVEDLFLAQHTSYETLSKQIGPVQQALREFKVALWERRAITPQAGLQQRIRNAIWTIFDDDDSAFELNRLYRRWSNEMETGMYDQVDYDLDLDRIRFNLSGDAVWPFIRDKLVHRCIEMWVNERFQAGLWVMPSDEIQQTVRPSPPNPSVHTPLHIIAQNAVRTTDSRYMERRDLESGGGRFRFNTNPQIGELYLPPDRILQVMNLRFSEVMTLRLETAFTEIVTYYSRVPYKEYDRLEEFFAAKTPKHLVEMLEQPWTWAETEDTGETWPAKFKRPSLMSLASDARGGTVVSLSEEEGSLGESQHSLSVAVDEDDQDQGHSHEGEVSVPKEPRIEVVSTNDHDHDLRPEFEIHEGWSTASEEVEPDEFDIGDGHEGDCTSQRSRMVSVVESVSHSPMLGKRKTSEDSELYAAEEDRLQRTRLGSGHTSQSGDSASTALVTPDESPSLLAEENIKVAEEEDVATDSTPVATLAMRDVDASPGASPTLGKRKSPEDDDLIQPARRTASLPTSRIDAVGEGEGNDNGVGELQGEVKGRVVDDVKGESQRAREQEEEAEMVEVTGADEGALAPDSPVRIDDKHSTSSMDTASSELSERLSMDPVQAAARQAVAAVAQHDTDSEGYDHALDSEDEASSLDSDEVQVSPFVPPAWADLGPGVEELIENAWYRAREPLRRCHCTICLRAEKAHSEQLQRILLSVDDLVSPGLHIA